MRAGTHELLTCLKRQRSLKLTRQHFADFADDLQTSGKDKFLDLIAEMLLAPPRRQSSTTAHDPLLERMLRYRKQSGLSASDFNAALRAKLEPNAIANTPKSVLASAPKYLSHLRQTLSASEIESGLAGVLAEYA